MGRNRKRRIPKSQRPKRLLEKAGFLCFSQKEASSGAGSSLVAMFSAHSPESSTELSVGIYLSKGIYSVEFSKRYWDLDAQKTRKKCVIAIRTHKFGDAARVALTTRRLRC